MLIVYDSAADQIKSKSIGTYNAAELMSVNDGHGSGRTCNKVVRDFMILCLLLENDPRIIFKFSFIHSARGHVR